VDERADLEPTGWRPGALQVVFVAVALVLAFELVAWSQIRSGGWSPLPNAAASDGVFVAAALSLAAVALAAGASRWGEAYAASLIAIAPIVPFAAALAILIVYLPEPTSPLPDPRYFGAAIGVGGWIVIGPAFMWMVRADTAQPRSYGELVFRTMRIRARLAGLREEAVGRPVGATQDVATHLEVLEAQLGLNGSPPGAGFRYGHATGYMNLWRALHRAEEALLILQPRPEAFAVAMYDVFRLQGTPNGDALVRKATNALAVFGDQAAPAICDPCVKPAPDPSAEDTAMAVLAETKKALNVYQDDVWERLIRQRNRLLRTVLITSTVALLFVGLAVTFETDRHVLGIVAVFFLVGAVTGLFGRLRAESSAGPADDDYGLFEARLLATPLLSGLAAIGGVVVVSMAEVLANVNPHLDWASIFNLSDNARGLLAAAIFGLTPELLIGRLGKQTDETLKQLNDTSPAIAG
jgi:hypothetical protein